MATTGFSATAYHSVPDHADFTLPNSDWAQLAIVRTDNVVDNQLIISSGEPYSGSTLHLIMFGNSFTIILDGDDSQAVNTATAGDWFLVCMQRASGTLTIRSVEMGLTTVSSSAGTAIAAAYNPGSEQRIGRSGGATASPFDGAVSDWLIVHDTISDSDLQDIATGTAIDSFAWYSSRVFWGIFTDSTGSDQTGDHTITENGTLSTTTDPGDLVRFGSIEQAIGLITETDTAQGLTSLKEIPIALTTETDTSQSTDPSKSASIGLNTETDTSQSITAIKPILQDIGLVTETDAAQSTTPDKVASIGLNTETDLAQAFITSTGTSIDQVIETDLAQTIRRQETPLTLATETDTAQNFGVGQHRIIGLTSEIDVSGILVPQMIVQLPLVTETDLAQDIAAIKPIIQAISLITETDLAQTIRAVNTSISQVFETDQATVFSFKTYREVIPTNPGADMYFIFDNLLDDVSSLTGSNTETDFDIDNVLNDEKTSMYRSTSAATQTITAIWTAAQDISAVALAFTNLVRNAEVTIKLYTNAADPSPVYNTGAKVVEYAYPPPRGFSTIGLVALAYGGGTYTSCLFPTQSIKKMEIEIDDSANPDGYIEVGKVITGKAFTPNYGAAYGISMPVQDNSQSSRTDAGNLVTTRGTIVKTVRFDVNLLNIESRRELMEMIRHNGRSGPLFASIHETSINPEERQSYMIYGTLDQLPAPQLVDFEKYSNNMLIMEV